MTEQQRRFFDTFGYIGFPGLLADCIDEIIDGFEAIWQENGGGHAGRPHEGTARSCIAQFLDHNERLCALLDDPRILGIAKALCGDDFNYMGSDGNYYVGDTGWHSDGWHRELRHVKIAFYLDPLTKDTGCLRVMPGSHRIGEGYTEELQTSLRQSRDLWGVTGPEVPAIALETQPGDVLVFNHNTKHAAFGGGTRRRMFTMNLCERYPDDKLQELRDYLSGGARFWVESAYHETLIATATPERLRHLEQVRANDGHLAELARAARAKMNEPSRG